MPEPRRARCQCGHTNLVHGDLVPMCLVAGCDCQCFVTAKPKLLNLDTLKEVARAC